MGRGGSACIVSRYRLKAVNFRGPLDSAAGLPRHPECSLIIYWRRAERLYLAWTPAAPGQVPVKVSAGRFQMLGLRQVVPERPEARVQRASGGPQRGAARAMRI